MDRTVPSTDSEEVELYLRTYYSLLRSSAEVHIKTLEEAHSGMHSLLHSSARDKNPDMSAFIYSLLRLPGNIFKTNKIVMGQSSDVFEREGFQNIENWETVTALARRRRYFFDGSGTLATYIVSRSDIDDLIPMLTGFQIEWNKLHLLLNQHGLLDLLLLEEQQDTLTSTLSEALNISLEDVERLQTIWKDDFVNKLLAIAKKECRFRVLLLSSSLSQYRRATYDWWVNIEDANPKVLTSPIYFVSSNSHSFVNILTGFALHHKQELLTFLRKSDNIALQKEWESIQSRQVPTSQENFFYYLLKVFLGTKAGKELAGMRQEVEKECDINRVNGGESFDLQAQVISLSSLNPKMMDPRLFDHDLEYLTKSDALILNIDYPLGMAAYHILSQIAERVRKVLGVYFMGKAAILNGVVGDVIIPNVVHDEQSKNTYFFSNSFRASDVTPYLVYGSVLDNQKAVTVRGTYLQTEHYMDVFYREGYSDIEMEAGPYLSATYEMFRPKRYPTNEIVNLQGVPFDIGILHYASDQPLSKGKNLGAANLSYFGMDPTYAASLAIIRRIIQTERARLL